MNKLEKITNTNNIGDFLMKKRSKWLIKKYTTDFIKILVGSAIMAISTALFLLPNKLSSGGFSGIATIVYYLFNFPMGITILSLNIPLFIMAYIRKGREVFIKSLMGTISFSTFLDIFTRFPALTSDRLLACIYGGILTGLGTAIILKGKSSTGGTDLVSYIIRTYKPQLRTSNLIVMIDAVIVTLNVLVFKEIEIGLYSAIAIYLMGKIIDIVFEGIYFTKMIYIVSPKYQRISDLINREVKRGTTGLYGKGMYKNEESLILLCLASRTETIKIIRITKKIDPTAFVVITNAREVIGKGFKRTL